MVNWVLLSMGSGDDPKLSEQTVRTSKGEVTLGAFFSGEHILMLGKEIIDSCHGNTEHSVGIAKQMKEVLVPDRRIAGIASGSLSFSKPGISSANSEVIPLVSVPISNPNKPAPVFGGLDSFLSCDCPPGIGAVGVAGFNNYTAAANVVRSMLKGQFNKVYVHSELPESVTETLLKYNIPFVRDTKPLDHLEGTIYLMPILPMNDVLREIDRTVKQGFVLGFPQRLLKPEDAVYIFHFMQGLNNTLYVGGDPKNLAHYVAKVYATRGDVGIAEQLKVAKEAKAKSYPYRDIGAEMAVIEARLMEGR